VLAQVSNLLNFRRMCCQIIYILLILSQIPKHPKLQSTINTRGIDGFCWRIPL